MIINQISQHNNTFGSRLNIPNHSSATDKFIKSYADQIGKKGAFDKFSAYNVETEEQKKLKHKFHKKLKNIIDLKISEAVLSVSNIDNTIDKYALKTFYALISGRTTDWIQNIKNWFKKKPCSNSYTKGGLTAIINIMSACKDSSGNHNKTNLKFAQKLETSTGYNYEDIPKIIKSCKNKEGVVSGNKYEFFQKLYQENLSEFMPFIADDNCEITENEKNFVLRNGKLAINDKTIKSFLTAVLKHSKGDDREKILENLSSNFYQVLLDEDNKLRAEFECLIDKSGNINYENIRQLIRLLNSHKFSDVIRAGNYWGFIQNNDGLITKQTVDELFRIDTHSSYTGINHNLSDMFGFKDENGDINPKFVDFFNKMKKMDILNESTFEDDYSDAMEIASKKNHIDWDVMNVFYQLSYKLDCYESSERVIIGLWKKAQQMAKDKNGNFTKEGLQKVVDLFKLEDKFEQKISLKKIYDSLKTKQTISVLETIVKDKNLYEASDMLEVFKELKLKRRLNQKNLNTPLKDWDNIMMIIPDILPTKTNKKEYNELLKMLRSIKDLNYNVKDKMGISFLEKVINSENHRLLDTMKSSSISLNYYPELEMIFNNIQNPLFKDIVENLDLKFTDLEEAAKLGSMEAFQKLEPHLNPVFMKDRQGELLKLQKLINQTKNKNLKKYFRENYEKEIKNGK